VNTMLYTLFVEDTVFSAIAALDLKKRLRTLAENSEEIQRLRLSIQDAYTRLEDARRGLDMSIESVQDIRKTEGNAAAARVAVQETMKVVRESAGIAEGKVRDMAENSVSNVKSLSEDARKALLLQKESMERRLSLLLDGGNESMSPMNWCTKTMLRNNPDAVSKEPTFGMLRAAALKRKEKKDRASREKERDFKREEQENKNRDDPKK
jgi:ribosomal protein S13